MFSELLLTIVSTTIVGGIVFIIFNLISNFGDEEQQKDSDKSVTNEFVDNRPQEKEECLANIESETQSDHLLSEEEVKSDQPLNSESVSENEKPIELSSDKSQENDSLINKSVDNEKSEQIDDNNDQNDDLLDFEEITEAIIEGAGQFIDERPDEHQVNDSMINEVVVKDVSKTYENEFKAESDPNSDNQIKAEINEEPLEEQDIGTNDLENEFWNLEDSQNLKHLNKSRPKKHKSRPSVKVVFTDESTPEDQQKAEDPVVKNARELVDNLFETLDSDVDEYKNRTDSTENSLKDEDSSEERKFESKTYETNETTISKNDDTFEEIASGEYKKFDEFSEHFRTETRRHETSRKVYEISSVKNFEITVDSNEPLNEEMFDNLMKNFEAIDSKTEVFEENYRKVTESESFQVRKGDQTSEVVPIRNEEMVSHTKSISERSLSSSSLSKMSLEDLNLNLKSSKSRLSETIDSVTKPLLSSPTLFRRSLISSDEELGAENDVNESPNRIQLPLFGRTQSMLMKEMKEKDFRNSLKPFNDLKFSDKNISNE